MEKKLKEKYKKQKICQKIGIWILKKKNLSWVKT